MTPAWRGIQRGAALITAMVTVALVATLAAGAAWQQWRSVEIEAAQRSRQQAGWILVGALDWARLILREDARTGGADHLAEPWAVPLEEAKLSTFLAAAASTGAAVDTTEPEITQAYMSGVITDQQGRLNLRNLVDGGRISVQHLQQFTKLWNLLDLPSAEILGAAENLRFALDTSADNRNGALAPLLPQRYVQATQLGLSARSLTVAAPFVTWLPEATTVNVNTAPAEVIYATLEADDMALARRLVTARALGPFKTLAEADRMLGDAPGQLRDGLHSVATRYFEVRGQLRLDDLVVQERSLVVRDGGEVRTVWRERLTPPPMSSSKTAAQAKVVEATK
jgi:general secretion pathway protein K